MCLMIPNIQDKKTEVHKIWLKYQNKLHAHELYSKYLGAYFDVKNWSRKSKEWMFYLVWVREWQKDLRKEYRAEAVSEERVEEAQIQNRRRMILILSHLIDAYEEAEGKDSRNTKFPISELLKMYNSIQTLEERMKMTQISKGKLKLEAVRTLLPYQRLTAPQIIELKSQLNESFERILKLKSGKPAGSNLTING